VEAVAGFAFVRHGDRLTYRFHREATLERPVYKREDAELWCSWIPGYGWGVHDADGAIVGRPLTPTDDDQHPPPGAWLSWKGAKSYLYDLVVTEQLSDGVR
jgi:hypothetical protein